jgi:hypothetical protein
MVQSLSWDIDGYLAGWQIYFRNLFTSRIYFCQFILVAVLPVCPAVALVDKNANA